MIAVLAVVLYHFGFPGLAGGFVGVDVFFVISGFLIGGILWRDFEANGRLNLSRFYIRRVKRLAPAYFAMAGATALAAWVILLPFEFREFGKSLIAATVYLSNILFYRGAGYFDIASELKPLLHTWSLSVEEQFYIVVPLMILLLKFSPRAVLGAMIVGFVASLVACVLITPHSQTATFYLFPFRAWELLAGVLLAVTGHRRGADWDIAPWASFAGLTMVLCGIALIQPGEGFPGWQATLPVLGTVLLLANGRNDNAVNRALSMRGPVFIGMISYSLYLWHWPVLILSTYWRGGYAGLYEAAAWMGLAFGLAILSWRFVERPVRELEGIRGRAVLIWLAIPTTAALAFGALAYIKDGLPGRFAPHVRPHIAASAAFLQDWSRCYRPAEGDFQGVEICPIGSEGAPKVLVWGDSHVRAFREGLNLAALEQGTPGWIIWHAGCAPLFDIDKRESYATRAQDAACRRDNDQIRKGLASLTGVSRVLLIGRWSYYAEGRGIGVDEDNTIALSGLGGSNNAQVLNRAIPPTVAELRRHFDEVHVLRQVPEVPGYDSRDAARDLAHGRRAAPFTVARADLTARIARSEAPWKGEEEAGSIRWIDTHETLCDGDTCGVIQNGESWYFDNNHINNIGAVQMRHLFAPLFQEGAS